MIKYSIKHTGRGLTTNCLPFFIMFWNSYQDGSSRILYAGERGLACKNPIGFKSEDDARKWIDKNSENLFTK